MILGDQVLLWLAVAGGAPRASRMDNGHSLRQTMMITLLNPKAIMFYMAFFPLLVDPVKHQGLVTFASLPPPWQW